MNFSLTLFGTPKNYSQCPVNEASAELFKKFYKNQKTDTQLTIHRDKQLFHYIYTHRLNSGVPGDYMGMCLTFNSVYYQHNREFLNLFGRIYFDIVLNRQIIQSEGNGKTLFVIDNFSIAQLEIARVKRLFQDNFNRDFGEHFAPFIPSFFNGSGNGGITLSAEADNNDIVAAMRDYDSVHIASNGAANTQLNQLNKLLSDLYLEKKVSTTKSNEQPGQKKGYDVFVFLLILFIGLAVWAYMKNYGELQDKNTIILSQKTEIANKKDTIEKLNDDIGILQLKKKDLEGQITRQKNIIAGKDTIISKNDTTIQSLNDTIRQKDAIISVQKTTMQKIQNSNNTLENQLKNTILYGSRIEIKRYIVKVPKAQCYIFCDNRYSPHQCEFHENNVVDVFVERDGYGLTISGFVKLSELERL